MIRAHLAPTLLAGALLIPACGGSGDGGQAPSAPSEPTRGEPAAPEPPGPSPASLRAEGRELFELRCATCHGEDGDGRGPGAAGLQPPPRDFRSAAWQASVSDQHLEQVISYGGAAVGLSPVMPAHPDLAHQPRQLEALVAFIRSLEGKSS